MLAVNWRWLSVAILVLCCLGSQTRGATPNVMTFLDWKSQRELEAQQNLERARKSAPSKASKQNKLSAAAANRPDETVSSPRSEGLQGVAGGATRFHRVAASEDSPLAQAENNLQVARNLTIHDYFALYLRFQPESQFREALDKLSKGDMTELMVGLRNRMNPPSDGSDSSGLTSAPVLASPSGRENRAL